VWRRSLHWRKISRWRYPLNVLRIEAPVPGKPYVGVEVPNVNSSVVRMKALA
jgi:hypothetical protein